MLNSLNSQLVTKLNSWIFKEVTMGLGTCKACGVPFTDTVRLGDAKKTYGKKVYDDFKERNYKDYNNICRECLRECRTLLYHK